MSGRIAMRRPKDPNNPKSGGAGDKAPPGGRARERLDQFNRQRELPDSPDSEKERPDDTQPGGGDKPAGQ
jgi:hypothetical protein